MNSEPTSWLRDYYDLLESGWAVSPEGSIPDAAWREHHHRPTAVTASTAFLDTTAGEVDTHAQRTRGTVPDLR